MDKSMILNIAICEDLQEDAARLQELILKSEVRSEVSLFTSGEDFLASFQAEMYDLIFMDIYMTGIRGIETVEAIRKIDERAVIAFTTSSPDHALESYKLDALRYLLKPVAEDDVNKTLELTLTQKKNRPAVDITLAGGEHAKVFLDTIMYLEHKDHVVEMHTEERLMQTSQSARLDKFEEILPSPPFLRSHRSYLVNLNHVERADKEINAFIMKNGDRADIKQGSFTKCRSALQEWRLAKAGSFPLFLCALVVVFVLSACVPEERVPTIARPYRPDEADRITTVIPEAPYTPAGEEQAADWPVQPITVIVPFLPGGDTDLYARMFAPLLADELGQPVYVINVDGGSGTFGANTVRTSTPDGYTMLFYHTGNLFTNVLTGETTLNYNDFEISCIAMHCNANVLVVHRDVGLNSAEEFLAHIKENPGNLRVATTITGFSFKLLRLAEIAGGFTTTPIHVGGGSMMAPSILAGHTEVGYNNLAIFMDYIESGEMIPLWVAAEERNILLPDVPTMAEVGIEGGFMGRSYFFALPIGTDEVILHRLSDAVRNITEDADFQRQIFDTVGLPPFFLPHDEASDYLSAMWSQLEGLEEYMQ